MLSKQALAIGHCTTLQNGHTVFGSVFARAALGMAAWAFFQGWRRFAGGAEAGIVPMPALLCLPGRRFGRGLGSTTPRSPLRVYKVITRVLTSAASAGTGKAWPSFN